MEYKLIEFGTTTSGGKTYTYGETDVTEDLIIGSIDFVDVNGKLKMDHPEAVAMGKVRKDESGVYLSDVITFGERGAEFASSVSSGCDIRPSGTGTVDVDGYVRTYTVTSFFVERDLA